METSHNRRKPIDAGYKGYMVKVVLEEKAAKVIEKYLFQTTNCVKRRIVDISSNITEKLAFQLQECTFFSLQLNKSMSVTNIAHGLHSCILTIKEIYNFCLRIFVLWAKSLSLMLLQKIFLTRLIIICQEWACLGFCWCLYRWNTSDA